MTTPRPFRALLLVASLLVSSACGSLDSSHVLTGMPHAAHSGPVEIVMQGQQPRRPYLEIAVVQANGSGVKAKMPKVIEALQAEAQRLGATAIIHVRIDQGSNNVAGSAVAVVYQ